MADIRRTVDNLRQLMARVTGNQPEDFEKIAQQAKKVSDSVK